MSTVTERVALPFSEMSHQGLLWLINRSVFHPRGLALGMVHVDGADEPVGWALTAASSGEPYTYGDTVDEAELFEKVTALFDGAHAAGRLPTRGADCVAPAAKGVYAQSAETEQPPATQEDERTAR